MKNSKRPKTKADNSLSVSLSGGQVGDISHDTATNMDKSRNTTNNTFMESKKQRAAGDQNFGFEKVDGIEGHHL